MDRRLFWLSLLITATIGTWLWHHVTGALSESFAPLLNFAGGFAVAGAAVLIARYLAGLDRDRK